MIYTNIIEVDKMNNNVLIPIFIVAFNMILVQNGFGFKDFNQINFQASFLGLTILEYVIYQLFFKYIWKNDKVFYHRAWDMGSFANYWNQTEGHSWTKALYVKDTMKIGDLFIDKFRFSISVKRYFNWYSLKNVFEDKECYINAKDLVKSAIIFGQMGSGKSEFYYSLIYQNQFNRYMIYDSKGDFTQIFYMPSRDIILNPYDERAHFWNPFEEAEYSEQIIDIFFTNLFNALSGDKKDFFSASAKKRYTDIFYEIAYKKKNLDAKVKFELFIEQLKLYFEEVVQLNQNSEKDIASTMKITFEFFEYMNFCIQKDDIKTFTINQFLKQKNCKLFLLDKEEYKGTLNPFFTAFIATFNTILLSKEDNKEDLTLLVLDEFLTFAKNIDDITLEGMFTRLRSKGGCLLPGVQYFPSGQDEKLSQKLLNSATYWFLFQGVDTYTLDKINKTIGQVKYSKSRKSNQNNTLFNQHNKEGFTAEKADLINTSIFQNLSQKFEHITFIPSKNILYLGYTPRINLKKRNFDFIKSTHYEEFWRSK